MCEIVCRTKTIIYYTLENDKRIIYYFVRSSVFYYVYRVYIVHTKRSKSALSHQTLLPVGKSRSPRPRVTFSSYPFRSTTACNELFLDHYTDIIIIIITRYAWELFFVFTSWRCIEKEEEHISSERWNLFLILFFPTVNNPQSSLCNHIK